MNEFDMLRQVLNGKAVSASNTAGIVVELANEGFDPPQDEIYGSFWFKTGDTKQIELGKAGSQELTVGIFQYDILIPEKQGDGPGTVIGDTIRKQFNRKEWIVAPYGYVKIVKSNVCQPFRGAQNGRFRLVVDGAFHFYHYDPEATFT